MKKSQLETLIREVLRETIRKVDGKYVVYPEKGGKRLGTHSSKAAAEKQLTAIHLNKEAVEIKYTTPNFDAEWEEAVRYPEFNSMGKESWIRTARVGQPVSYSSIKDVLGNVDLNFKDLEEPKKQRFQAAFHKGVIEMPIAVKFSDNDYDLVAGNTRLSGLVQNGINPKIWIVDLSEMQENYADGKEKEIANDILSGLNEGKVDGVLTKMKQYAKKGLLTLAVIASVTQGLQAQGIAQSDIDAVNQQGIELVQQAYTVSRMTERLIVQTLGQQKFDAFVKLAKENGLRLGAGKGRSLSMAQSQSKLQALSGINGRVTTRTVESKTIRTSDGQYLVIQFIQVNVQENYADGKVNESGYEEAWELLGQPVPEIKNFVKQLGLKNDDATAKKIGAIIDSIKDSSLPANRIPGLKNLANKGNDSETLKAIKQISGKPDAEQQYTKLMQARDAGEKRNRGYNVSDLIKAVKSGNYEPPVLLQLPSGLYVIGGRTRLYAALALGVKAKVKIITSDTFKQVKENYADGKVKGKSRPGRVKKAGASCKGSVSDLRAKAKKYGGEKGKMYHWCANMKSGRK